MRKFFFHKQEAFAESREASLVDKISLIELSETLKDQVCTPPLQHF